MCVCVCVCAWVSLRARRVWRVFIHSIDHVDHTNHTGHNDAAVPCPRYPALPCPPCTSAAVLLRLCCYRCHSRCHSFVPILRTNGGVHPYFRLYIICILQHICEAYAVSVGMRPSAAVPPSSSSSFWGIGVGGMSKYANLRYPTARWITILEIVISEKAQSMYHTCDKLVAPWLPMRAHIECEVSFKRKFCNVSHLLP